MSSVALRPKPRRDGGALGVELALQCQVQAFAIIGDGDVQARRAVHIDPFERGKGRQRRNDQVCLCLDIAACLGRPSEFRQRMDERKADRPRRGGKIGLGLEPDRCTGKQVGIFAGQGDGLGRTFKLRAAGISGEDQCHLSRLEIADGAIAEQ